MGQKREGRDEGGRFREGGEGNPGKGRKEGTKVAPEFLRDLRHVYKTKPPGEGEEEESPGRQMLRELKKSSPDKFLDRLQKAEREWLLAQRGVAEPAGGSGEAAPAAALVPDEGSERQREILNEWLADPRNWGAK